MEFLEVALMFYKVHIQSLNLNINFEFFRGKSRVLLSFEYVLLSYPKKGFQLPADAGEKKWKSNDSFLNLAGKYLSYLA